MLFTLHRLAQSAIHTKNDRVADITDAVRSARRDGLLPGVRQSDVVAAVRELIAAHQGNRLRKLQRNLPSQYRKPGIVPAASVQAVPGVDLLALPLADKAARRSSRLAESAYRGRYRTCRQGHETRIKIGSPAVSSGTVRGEQYSSRSFCRKTESVHTLTIPSLWCVRVHARGLDVCDGMFTLDAQRVPGAGAELYQAMWIEQGAGTSLKLARGYIARVGEITYHAKTARAALDGVRRKAGQLPARRKPVLNLDRLSRRHGGAVVTLADSEAAGNCESGTRSWCLAVGIDPDQPATLAAVIAGYKVRPLAEAMAVIRRVLRDAKHRERQPVDELEIALRVAVATGETHPALLRDYQEERGALVS